MSASKKEFFPEMLLVPEGFFLMGSEDGSDNEKPAHRVWVDGFKIGKFPVTNAEYRIFVEEAGHPEPPFWQEEAFADPKKPVVGVNWHEAVAYSEWLSRRSGSNFRLPTEAEWERAAREDKDGHAYPWGDEPPWERPYPGYDLKSGGPERVGTGEPNGFGLYGMSGGVHEWCSDFYDADYYRYSPERNPQGPPSGERRASRGGSWRHRIKFSRCAARSSLPPAFRYADYGFRVVASL